MASFIPLYSLMPRLAESPVRAPKKPMVMPAGHVPEEPPAAAEELDELEELEELEHAATPIAAAAKTARVRHVTRRSGIQDLLVRSMIGFR